MVIEDLQQYVLVCIEFHMEWGVSIIHLAKLLPHVATL